MSHSHPHDHSHHGHRHGHGSLTAKLNKEHFDKKADIYANNPSHVNLANHVSKAILANLPFDEDTTRFLDVACGPGLISRNILPHVKSIVGLDISPSMVAEFNKSASDQGLTKDEIHAVELDITADTLPAELSGEDYHNFDVAVCVLAMHHMDKPDLATKRIVERLKVGGYFGVVEFRTHDMEERFKEAYKDIVTHHGFSEGDMKKMFEDAGLVDFKFVEVGPEGSAGKGFTLGVDMENGEQRKIEREVFMAIGKKA